jgi:hypothetical protein
MVRHSFSAKQSESAFKSERSKIAGRVAAVRSHEVAARGAPENEVTENVDAHRQRRSDCGQRIIARNGYHAER